MGARLAFCLGLALAAAAAQAQDRAKDHEALRALLAKGVEALNKRNFDAIAPSVHPSFTIITVDDRKHVGLESFKKYYAAQFEGPDAILKNFETRAEADEETRFIDADTGIVYGTSRETYTFRDGDVRTMRTRWSAVTKKEGGAWKLASVHFSANVLDNPVLDGVKSFYNKLAVGAGLAGLVLGAALVAVFRRRPAS